MKTNSTKKSVLFGGFIAYVYDISQPCAASYQGGTDADHIPVIPGQHFYSGTGDEDDFSPPYSALTFVDTDPTPIGEESVS